MTSMADNLRGALFMVLSLAGFALNDALMKLLSSDIPLFQAIFLRGLAACLLVGTLAWYRHALWCRLSARGAMMIGLRVVGELGATIGFLTALFNMPIANATAILQAIPLAVTLGAALFLGEAVGWRRYSAIGVGFLGVMLIIRPGAEGFTVYSLYALMAVAFLVLRDLATRSLPADIPSMFVTLISTVAITLMGAIVSAIAVFSKIQSWHPVSMAEIGMLSLAAIFVFVGYLGGISAMRTGDISFISPFRYSVLLWAMLLGFLIFGEIPDPMMLLGSLIVVLTGLYTLYRERVRERRVRTGPVPISGR
ncbi:MAG: DMT family transporter [Geminicoccaceae bacterium]